MDHRHANETGLIEADVQHRPDIARLILDARIAQGVWAETPLRRRLGVITRLRHLIARNAAELSQSVGERPGRAEGETLALEVLPLADACRFLEREAEAVLAPKRLGSKGRPLWLSGASAEIRREPLGVILIVAPSNYPLFLPGVQIVQALVAGNAVLIKPAPGCIEPMRALLGLLEEAGLPAGLCELLGKSVENGREAIAAGVDKLVLTGSAETGRRVLTDLAPHLDSGRDGVIGQRCRLRAARRRPRPDGEGVGLRAAAERRRHLHSAPARLRRPWLRTGPGAAAGPAGTGNSACRIARAGTDPGRPFAR